MWLLWLLGIVVNTVKKKSIHRPLNTMRISFHMSYSKYIITSSHNIFIHVYWIVCAVAVGMLLSKVIQWKNVQDWSNVNHLKSNKLIKISYRKLQSRVRSWNLNLYNKTSSFWRYKRIVCGLSVHHCPSLHSIIQVVVNFATSLFCVFVFACIY